MIKYIIKKLISITWYAKFISYRFVWNRESNAETETAKANDVVAIDKPILGNLAQIGQQTHFYDPPLIYGKLVYGYDSAMYNHGFSWPWGSYLVIRQFNNENNANNTIASYKVNTKKWDFFYNPQISPDGQYITFKLVISRQALVPIPYICFRLPPKSLKLLTRLNSASGAIPGTLVTE